MVVAPCRIVGSNEMSMHAVKSAILSRLWTGRVAWLMWRQRKSVSDPYVSRIRALHQILRLPGEYSSVDLQIYRKPSDLVSLPCGPRGAERWLSASIVSRWENMRSAAKAEGVTLFVKSAFRSLDDQANIIKDQLSTGARMNDILKSVAAPGYSEHQSGRALDIGTDVGDENFESSNAFRWLEENATNFGFLLSYPRNNSKGIIYEPWHWYCQPDQ
jgi:D-alanyl-D-alanine carboxypeptidase